MSIGRLDVKSLINLVDEEKLRRELDKDTYYWYWYCPDSGYEEYDSRYHRFETTVNPIEYLIFNDDSFVSTLLEIMSDLEDKIRFDIEDDYYKYESHEQPSCLYIEALDENESDKSFNEDVLFDQLRNQCGTHYAEIIWKHLNNMTIDEILKEFKNAHWGSGSRLHLLDSDFNHILPTGKHNYDDTKKLFLQWGFKE